jgi:hypothetical protein
MLAPCSVPAAIGREIAGVHSHQLAEECDEPGQHNRWVCKKGRDDHQNILLSLADPRR